MVPSVLGSTPHRAASVGLLAEKDDEFAGFGGASSRSPSRPLLRISRLLLPRLHQAEHALSRSRSPSFAGSGSHLSGAASGAAAFLEGESVKFLNYCRRQRLALPAPLEEEEEEQLLFSDVVPAATTNSSTAAQAMYHLLCLATKGMVKVRQDEAYGEVRLSSFFLFFSLSFS
jgi:hypothetical protein